MCRHSHPWDAKWGDKRTVFDATRLEPPPAKPCGVATPAIDAIIAESPTIDYDDFADRSPESKVDSNHDPDPESDYHSGL